MEPALKGSKSRMPRLVLLLSCFSPILVMWWQLTTENLGPDPAKALMQGTGEWSLRGLILVLSVTPLAQLLWPAAHKYRRALGLTIFGYSSIHLLLFLQVYVGWTGVLLLEELQERPYIFAGFVAWLLLLPLAITSTRRARKSMGQRWRYLHFLVYPAALLAWLHLFWMARSDIGKALIYGLLLGLLFVWRIWRVARKRRSLSHLSASMID